MRFFSFSLLILLAALAGHAYLYRRLVHDTTRHTGLRVAGLLLLVLLTAALGLRRRVLDLLPESFSGVFTTGVYVWMGAALLLVQALVLTDLLRLFLSLRKRTEEVNPERRLFLSRSLAGGALVLGSGSSLYGMGRAFGEQELSVVEVKVPRLPKSLDGFSIVQLTDIHVGPIIERRFMDELVARANALEPDLVAITGDLVDGSVEALGPAVSALANLKSRYGSFFVTGNHEYYSGEVEWVAFLESIGVSVLRNRHVSIGDEAGSFDLVGVDDWSGGRRRGRPGYDLDKALEGRDPTRAAVLLAHQPANFREASERGIGLQISGHTHGGQIFPMTLAVGLEWEYVQGLYTLGDSSIYVSRGCGFWGPPMRIGSPPEIVKLVLRSP